MIPAPARLSKLLSLLERAYLRVGVRERDELLPAADNYDLWFRDQAVPQIEALLVIDRGRWTDKAGPNAIPAAGRIVEEGFARYLLQPVTDWTLEHFPQFWQAGWQLWRLTRELNMLPTPAQVRMLEPEVNAVAGYQRAELSAWQDHGARHRRHVERFVHTATAQGWTAAEFIRNMTARDGHVVGFRYGNADLSWYEHLRRYTAGRPRMLAQAALEWRMRNAPQGR